MTRDTKQTDERDPPRRRATDRRGSGPRKQRDYVKRAMAGNHSGHGSESVVPHLHDQLRLKALLPSAHPLPDFQQPAKDAHHR